MFRIALILLSAFCVNAHADNLSCDYIGYDGLNVGSVKATVNSGESRNIEAVTMYPWWAKEDNPQYATNHFDRFSSRLVSLIYMPEREMLFTVENDEAEEIVILKYTQALGGVYIGEQNITWKKTDRPYFKSIAKCKFN